MFCIIPSLTVFGLLYGPLEYHTHNSAQTAGLRFDNHDQARLIRKGSAKLNEDKTQVKEGEIVSLTFVDGSLFESTSRIDVSVILFAGPGVSFSADDKLEVTMAWHGGPLPLRIVKTKVPVGNMSYDKKTNSYCLLIEDAFTSYFTRQFEDGNANTNKPLPMGNATLSIQTVCKKKTIGKHDFPVEVADLLR